MSLGSVLLRPQALNTVASSQEAQPLRAVLALFDGLAQEAAAGGPGLAMVKEELIASLDELIAEMEPPMDAAQARVTALFEPLAGLAGGVFEAGPAVGDFAQAARAGQAALAALTAALQGLTAPKLAGFLGAFLDILVTDLGLSEARLQQLLGEVLGRIVTRLQADYLAGDGTAFRRYALGGAFQELQVLASQDLGLSVLNKDALLPAAIKVLQGLKLDAWLGDLAKAVSRANDSLDAAIALQELLAQATTPSLRMQLDLRTGEPATRTCWYASWLAGNVVKHADPTSSGALGQITFGRSSLSAATMEKVAWHSKWIASLAETGFHAGAIGFEPRHFVSNLMNMLWLVTEGGLAMGGYAYPRWLKYTWWLSNSLPVIGPVGWLGVLDDRHARRFFGDAYGTLILLFNFVEMQLYARWVWLLRESLLSILTLMNHREGGVNRNHMEGLAHLFGEVGTLLMPIILSQVAKDKYGFPNGGGNWGHLVGCALGSWLLNLVFSYLGGILVGRAISGSNPEDTRMLRLFLKDRVFGRFEGAWGTAWDVIKGVLLVPVSGILDFFVYLYLFTEGKTDGKLSARTGFSYPGYPDRSNSPYRLPWEQGSVLRCVQGNLGLWSHTPFSFEYQIYGYDFSHDHGDDVLAMRDGTVWQCDDNNPDGGDVQNTITILHGAAVNGHDFDQNGNSRRTLAVYVHGQQDSIKNAFGGGALPAIGTPVPRGKVIMKADDTGRSAYNHLHIQVQPATVNAAGTVTGTEDYTIPFVFGDEEVERDDGVPKSLHSYESDNVKVP